jgi:dTDP-4-amino-4,6-dideoxygalactose transaminase
VDEDLREPEREFHVDGRDALLAKLNEHDIPARLNGCPNLHGEPVFKERGNEWLCPVADRIGARTLGLPVYPTVSDEEAVKIAAHVREFMTG